MFQKYYLLFKKRYLWGLLLIPVGLIPLLIGSPEKPIKKELSLVSSAEPIIESIKVDVKGFVNKPGIYELEVNSRLIDAINASGGLTPEADTSTINLSKILKDEMVIIIYSKSEIKSMITGNTTVKYIEKECICPVIKNDACIEDKVTNDSTQTSGPTETTLVSINHGDVVALDTLPGIGPAKAQDIIDYRTTNGDFKTLEELKNVSGIGDVTFEKLKALITL